MHRPRPILTVPLAVSRQAISWQVISWQVIGRLLLAVLVLATLAVTAPSNARAQSIGVLAPPDTSSPRATLRSFLDNMEVAYRPFIDGTSKELPIWSEAALRATLTMDTSLITDAQGLRGAIDASVRLYEVIARTNMPHPASIPDAAAMASLSKDTPRRWNVPGTSIVISRVEEGPRKGEYLFSAATTASTVRMFRSVFDQPYKPGYMEGLAVRLEGMPGNWIPVEWIDALPAFARSSPFGLTNWKLYAWRLTLLLLFVVLLSVIRYVQAHREERWKDLAAIGIALGAIAFSHFFISGEIIIVGALWRTTNVVLILLAYVFGLFGLYFLGSAISRAVLASAALQKADINIQVIALIIRILALIAAIALVIHCMTVFGVPIAAILTSLGVGGFAIGLAARPTLENLIAGITILLDKSVKVGEFCQYQQTMGTVEEIGLRSTQIRRWDGNLITIPNSKFVEAELDNYNDSKYILIRTDLFLRYETSPEQLRFVLARIREMLTAHPQILSPRVRFMDFGESGLQVDVLAYANTGIWAEWYAIREDIYLRILDIVDDAGTAIAMPSQTTYLARDEGLDEQKTEAAEKTVGKWRKAGELPFPDMTAEQIEALKETLDYPPKGSIGLAKAAGPEGPDAEPAEAPGGEGKG